MLNSTAKTNYTANLPESRDFQFNNWAECILLMIDSDDSKLATRGNEALVRLGVRSRSVPRNLFMPRL